jgi:hypothetical protein
MFKITQLVEYARLFHHVGSRQWRRSAIATSSAALDAQGYFGCGTTV